MTCNQKLKIPELHRIIDPVFGFLNMIIGSPSAELLKRIKNLTRGVCIAWFIV